MPRTLHLRFLLAIGLLTLGLCAVVARDATALPAGLLAWWSSDVDAHDNSGQNNHGTLVGGVQVGVPGLMGGPFSLMAPVLWSAPR